MATRAVVALVLLSGPALAQTSSEAAPPPTPAARPAASSASTAEQPAVRQRDDLPRAGYISGYRLDPILGLSPFVPRVGALPGGVTPSYAAPSPPSEWTFRWTGFLTASLQTSTNQRVSPAPGQSTTVFHVPPQTVDEYGSFIGTTTVPGQWAQLNFVYGNRYVAANVSLTTWNPSDTSTYYAIGSQQFINNAFLAYSPPPIAGIRVHAMAGYFSNSYGAVGQYGFGMYTNALIGNVRGVGEDVVAEYDASETVTLRLEDGIMGNRNGMGAINIVRTGQNGGGNPIVWPSAWIHHLHVGIEKRGELTFHGSLHYLTNWVQDDRLQTTQTNPQVRQIDETYVKDGRVQTFGAEAGVLSPILGYLGAAASYTRGDNAYPVKGLVTFGGDGESLTNRWFGQLSGGTGEFVAAGINYSASIGRIASYPVPFNGDGPDLALSAGLVVAESWASDTAALVGIPASAARPFQGRARYKGGVDLLYTFFPFMAAGLRGDVVVPNAKDSQETFAVVAPRLVLKSDWNSRDTVSLIYAKWFYGSHTHPEASALTPGDRLDDQLFAVNVQMWW